MTSKAKMTSEQEADLLKEEARISSLLSKHNLQLDDETNEIVKLIAAGKVVSGITGALSKDWCVSQLIKFWTECPRASTKQRTFEFICELLGHIPKGGGKESSVYDIAFGDEK